MKDVIRSMAHLAAGTAAAQVITLSLLPIISRAYTPVDFGRYAMIMVAVGLVSILSTLQLAQAIVIPAVNSHARSIARLSLFGAAIGGVATVVLMLPLAMSRLAHPLLAAIMCGTAVVLSGTFMTLQALAVRSQSFVWVGAASSVRALLVGAMQLLFSLGMANELGLLAGYIGGELAACVVLWAKAIPTELRDLRLRSRAEARAVLRRYRDFATYGTAVEAMNAASQGIPVLLLGAYFGQAVAGLYSFSMRILLAPGQLIANAVRQVLSQRFARLLKKPAILRREFYLFTLGLAIPATLGAVLVGGYLPEIFSFVFGEQWRESGDYAKWLVIWVAFLIFNVPAAVVMRVARRQRENFILNFLILFTRVGILIVGGVWLTALEAVAAFALLGALWNVVYIFLARRHLPVLD